MFREMRRARQQISQAECAEILRRATSGVLAVAGDDGYPYAVPLSFAYLEDPAGGLGRICFHCATSGHKIDALRRSDKVSFCVIDRDEVMPAARTTKFCSVIAFGRARILEDEAEMRASARAVGAKYSGDYPEACEEEIDDTLRRGTLCCVEIAIEHLTGKIGLELLQEREGRGR